MVEKVGRSAVPGECGHGGLAEAEATVVRWHDPMGQYLETLVPQLIPAEPEQQHVLEHPAGQPDLWSRWVPSWPRPGSAQRWWTDASELFGVTLARAAD